MIQLSELKEVMTMMAETITHDIIERGEDMCPVAFVFHHDGKLDIEGMVFSSKEAKNKLMAALSRRSLEPDVRAVGFLLDTYTMGVLTEKQVREVMASGGVAAQPERKEALLAQIVERDSIVSIGSQQYDRVLESPRIIWHPWIWRDEGVESVTVERGF